MLPLSDWPLTARRNIIGIFTDIDDTLTTEGAITADALQALGDLKAAGLHVIAITGRPVGWSEQVAFGGDNAWPVDAVVAENGSVALFLIKSSVLPPKNIPKSLSKIYQQDAVTRSTNYVRMQHVTARVVREVSGAKLSQDSKGRETDIAIDHSEFTTLSAEKIQQAVNIMQSAHDQRMERPQQEHCRQADMHQRQCPFVAATRDGAACQPCSGNDHPGPDQPQQQPGRKATTVQASFVAYSVIDGRALCPIGDTQEQRRTVGKTDRRHQSPSRSFIRAR